MIENLKSDRRQLRWSFITLITGLFTIFIGLSATPLAQAVPSVRETAKQTLMDKAINNGSMRVIVGLNIPFIPEGELADVAGAQAVISQQEAIQAAQSTVLQRVAEFNSELVAKFKYIPAMALVVDADSLDALSKLPEVAYVQEDMLSAATLSSSIPVIGADDAWANGHSGSGQTVAILDTGVDSTHTYFPSGKIVSEACFSTTYAPYGSTTVCPNGGEFQIGTGAGVDCTAQVSGDAVSDCAHGTHVAGTAAGNDGAGPHIGVAKDADIIAIQVFSYFSGGIVCTNCALTYSSDQIEGLERVYDLRNNFDIASVNMSLGGSTLYTSVCDSVETARKAAIDNLRAVGIATIIATGNDGNRNGISAPACISTAISVGSTEDDDDVSSFSNVASIMDLFAPGTSITSSVPGTNQTGTWNGTSMATPHVAGAWAVVREMEPTTTVDDIIANLKSTGTLINDTRTGGIVTNVPRINLDQALSQIGSPTATNDGSPTEKNTSITINVTANDFDPMNDPLTIINVGTPSHGSAVQINNTDIQYTPTTDYSGADSFTYTISDGFGNTDLGTVTIIVDGESAFLPAVLRN